MRVTNVINTLKMLEERVDEEGNIILDTWYDGIDQDIKEALKQTVETLEKEPTVHAHWIPVNKYYERARKKGKAYTFECSNCCSRVYEPRLVAAIELGYPYCPHCGAKMYEELDDKTD